MSNKMRGGSGRSVVGVCVAAALLFGLMASPASASDNPNDEWIRGMLKGGEIVIQEDGEKPEQIFPLGEKDGPTECNPEEKRSQVKAFVDSSKDVDSIEFNFAPGQVDDVAIINYLCVQINVKNNPEGHIADKELFIKDPGPQLSITFYRTDNPFPPFINAFACRMELSPVGVSGPFSEPKAEELEDKWLEDPWDWNLDLFSNSKATVPAINPNDPHPAPGCPALVASSINDALQINESREADAHFKFIVYSEGQNEPDLKP